MSPTTDNAVGRTGLSVRSELLLLVIGIAAVLIAAAVVAEFAGPTAWLLVAVLGAGYMLSRGAGKSHVPTRASRSVSPLRSAAPLTSSRDEGDGEGVEVTTAREELRVDKHARPHERIRVTKEVVTEEVTVTVPVRREELRLERVPITDDEPSPGTVELGAAMPDYEITLMHEVPIVDKHVVARERVRVSKDVVTDQRSISTELRREEVDVDQHAAPSDSTNQ